MTDKAIPPYVVGLEVSNAERLIEASGLNVRKCLVACRKGAKGDSARVIRQRTDDDGVVVIDYSLFKTVIDE